MHQCLHYSTSQQGGILDLVFDSKIAQKVSWIPWPYGEHVTLCIEF